MHQRSATAPLAFPSFDWLMRSHFSNNLPMNGSHFDLKKIMLVRNFHFIFHRIK